ncbi:hypothetical protein E4U54_004008 [Claviceps lovelessii]|nr:hypothetical protein E4U54_004008 [Claviceps lovelessii]
MTSAFRIALVGLSIVFLTLTLFAYPASASNECQPWTWGEDPASGPLKLSSQPEEDDGNRPGPKMGEVNCNDYSRSPASVNYYTCTQMARQRGITTDEFFLLNPSVEKDCSNLKPDTRYCISGFIEPLRAWDGLCGPNHNNALCYDTPKPCCNSITWKCGDSL